MAKNYYSFSNSTRRRAGAHGVDTIFAWTIFIFLLIGFALFCWMGSFYIFGHPEKAGNYHLLKRLHKLDDLQRFEITVAPRGEFLKPGQLLERFGHLSSQDMKRLNDALLRNFLRNYHQTHDLIPYATGTYKVLAAFPLTQQQMFHPGMSALLQAVEQPEILLEQVFPIANDDRLILKLTKVNEISGKHGLQPPSLHTDASQKAMKSFAPKDVFSKKSNLVALQQALPTGQEMKLEKPLDLSAIIHVERLADGRIKLTTMPLLYGTYGANEGSTHFSLDPPVDLNMEAGLPLLSAKEVANADEQHTAYRSSTPLHSLLKSQVGDEAKPTDQNKNVLQLQLPSLPAAKQQERALPVNVPAVLPALPVTTAVTPTLRATAASPAQAIPVLATSKIAPTPTPTPAPLPTATPAPAIVTVAALNTPSPFLTPATNALSGTTPSIISTAAWPLYDSGKMPRGRLVEPTELRSLAEQGLAGERLYLQGNFSVTASGQDRSVLRYQSSTSSLALDRVGKTRIIVSYPPGAIPPAEGTSLTRNQERPFMITDVKKGSDGTVNVYVREITR